MKWYCYKTTNTLNGYYYLGKYGSENPETDSYLGSGTAFRRALKKYGREVFVKEILAEFETEDEAYAFERNLISENDLKSNQCYNIVPGGRGGVGLRPKGSLGKLILEKNFHQKRLRRLERQNLLEEQIGTLQRQFRN